MDFISTSTILPLHIYIFCTLLYVLLTVGKHADINILTKPS